MGSAYWCIYFALHLVFVLFEFVKVEVVPLLIGYHLQVYLFELCLLLANLLLLFCDLGFEPRKVGIYVGDASVVNEVDLALSLVE